MANSINTVAKGDAFEEKVYEYIDTLLNDDNFVVPGKRSLLFKKKRYYSNSRKNDIIIDVSVETYLPDSTEYSMLTIIECKDYKNNVSIDNLEEFVSKLNQIAGKNVKGAFFTTSGFSQTCINYAKENGLWLAVFKDGAFNNLTFRKSKKNHFSNQVNEDIIFYATDGISKCRSLSKLLIQLKIIDVCKLNTVNVPYISEIELSEIANAYRKQIQKKDLSPLTIDIVSDAIKNDFGIRVERKQFQSNFMEDKPLGAIDVSNKLILLSDDVDDAHRTLFTLSHEVAHWILHRQYIAEGIYTDNILYENDTSRIEFQANQFASFFLIPEKDLRIMTVFAFSFHKNPRKEKLWWDKQPCNMELAHKILDYLSEWFNVSKEMLIIRLEHNGMLERHF